MLTAIVLAFHPPNSRPAGAARGDGVVRSLASLVEACVQGLVADAILVGPPHMGLRRIADEAGCVLVEADDAREGLATALQAARHAHVFLLEAGHAVERGFIDEVGDLLVGDLLAGDLLAYGGAARVLRAGPDSLLTRLAPKLARPVGLIAGKQALLAAGLGDVAALARKLRAGELSARARRTP